MIYKLFTHYLSFSIYVYFTWIFIHFLSTHLYVQLCVPRTFYGLIYSPFMNQIPHCVGLLWTMTKGSEMINLMWIAIGKLLMDNVYSRLKHT